jgi:hypothetical protein
LFLLQAKTRERSVRQFGATVGQFRRHVKEYLDVATGVTTPAGLPSDRRRDDLEALVWKALQDAQEFMKTEEAAKYAKAIVQGFRVVEGFG